MESAGEEVEQESVVKEQQIESAEKDIVGGMAEIEAPVGVMQTRSKRPSRCIKLGEQIV